MSRTKRDYLGVSENRGTSKSSILIRFSIVNHSFWVPSFLETPISIPEIHTSTPTQPTKPFGIFFRGRNSLRFFRWWKKNCTAVPALLTWAQRSKCPKSTNPLQSSVEVGIVSTHVFFNRENIKKKNNTVGRYFGWEALLYQQMVPEFYVVQF